MLIPPLLSFFAPTRPAPEDAGLNRPVATPGMIMSINGRGTKRFPRVCSKTPHPVRGPPTLGIILLREHRQEAHVLHEGDAGRLVFFVDYTRLTRPGNSLAGFAREKKKPCA